jgi:hypothetical protein
LVQQAHSTFPLQPDSSPNSTLRIHTTTVVDGSKGTHTLDVLGGSYSFEKQFRTQMDLLARQICFRNKKWTQPLTELCGAAVDARVYLAFLFASNVDERRRASRGEDDDDEVMHGNNLGLQLINFILSRLDEAIAVVMDGFENGQTENDEEYWADASIAAAILCKRLLSVHKDLVGECVRPFCVRILPGTWG